MPVGLFYDYGDGGTTITYPSNEAGDTSTYDIEGGSIITVAIQHKLNTGYEYKVVHITEPNGATVHFVPKAYLTADADVLYYTIVKSTVEEWTFTLEDGTTVTKNVVVR